MSQAVTFFPLPVQSTTGTFNRPRLKSQTAIELSHCPTEPETEITFVGLDQKCFRCDPNQKDGENENEDINLQDSFGNTSLHLAALHGHLTCVQKLLDAGASPKIVNKTGQTPLHLAVLGTNDQSSRCVTTLAKHEDSDLNVKDFKSPLSSPELRSFGNSALHYAALRRLANCVEILLEAGADPNLRNKSGQTPLHWAVLGSTQCDVKCVGLIANHCSAIAVTDVNVQDNEGVTPLHLSAEKKSFQSAAVLLEAGAYLNVKSKDLRLFNHSWLITVFVKIGVKISFLAKWIGSINENLFSDKNQDKIITSRFALPHLLQEMPFLDESINARLDKAITFDTESTQAVRPSHGTCRVKINFRSILPYSDPYLKESGNDDTINFHKLEKETEFLADILKANRSASKKFLTHPVIIAFMHLKWQRICWFFKFYTLVNTLLAGLFTFYTLSVYLMYCPYHIRQGLSPSVNLRNDDTKEGRPIFAWLDFSYGTRPRAQNKFCRPDPSDWGMFIVSVSLLILTAFVVLDELYKLVKNLKMYFRTYRNFFQWVTIVCIVLTAWPIPPQGLRLHNWQYGAAAYGIFNSWAILLTQVGRYPVAGLYVEMFVKVLKNFGFFIAAYAFLLIAFATAFCIVFPGYPPFSSIPRAFLKVLTMMTGDIEYQDLFYNNGGGSDKDNTWGSGGQIHLFHPVTAHLLYGAFVVIVTIVLMNLLVGLAVNDIQGLRKEAELNRISRQIGEISNLENVFFSETFARLRCFETWLGRVLRRRIGVKNTLLSEDGSYCFSANSVNTEVCLPEELMTKALQLANKNSDASAVKEASTVICANCARKNIKSFQFRSLGVSD